MSSFVRTALAGVRYISVHAAGAPERQGEVPVTVPRHTSLKELTIHNSDRFDASIASIDAGGEPVEIQACRYDHRHYRLGISFGA